MALAAARAGGAARGLEAGLRHAVAGYPYGELDQVAAGGSAGRALVGRTGERSLAARVVEMLGQTRTHTGPSVT